MRTFWAGTLPLVMVAGALVATPQVLSPTPAAAAPATTLSPANPIKLERFNYYSGVTTKFVRPVVLQKKVGNSWRTIYSGHTGANGKFRFTVHTGSVDTLRSYSAAYRYRGKTYPSAATAPITVRPRAQTITLAMGSTTTAYIDTTPARNGRTLILQRQTGRAWTTIATGKTNSAGSGTFALKAYNSRATYRAIASAWNGAPAITTPITARSTAADGLVVALPVRAASTAAQLRALHLSPDLTQFLSGRLHQCTGGPTQIKVKHFRMNDMADGTVGCPPDGGGYAAIWYKKADRWHEFGTNDAVYCSDLARLGVPVPPAGFLGHDCEPD